jgi:hypothetical protein
MTARHAATAAESNGKTLLTVSMLNAELTKRPHKQRVVWDSKQAGLCVLISRGAKNAHRATVNFRVAFYLKNIPGKPQYISLGRYPDGQYTYTKNGKQITAACSDIEAMRRAASNIRNDAKDQGVDPRRPPASTVFEDVVADFLKLHASKNRRAAETKRIFDRYVLPQWRFKSIKDIDRNAVTHLLDKIEQKQIRYEGRSIGTPLVATSVLIQLSKLFNWHAARSNDFTSPLVKGMARGKAKARTLFLNDVELRTLWPLLDDSVFGAVVKTALLTAQRFHKVSGMRRADLKDHLTVPGHYDADQQWIDDVEIDHVWNASRDDDPANKQVSAVPLSAATRAVIAAVPDLGGDYVFTLDGREAPRGFSKYKYQLDARMKAVLAAQGVEFRPWQYRDLRRTAKVLMKRAGVSREISELCLAHVIKGVEGTYDRYDYLREKQDAFDRLAALVERIVNPPSADNVVPLQRPRRQTRAARRGH